MTQPDATPAPSSVGLPRRPVIVSGPEPFHDLTRALQHTPGFPELLAALRNGRGATIDGAWGSAASLAAAALALHAPSTLLCLVAHVGDVDDFAADLATFSGLRPEILPAWETLPGESQRNDSVTGARLRLARRLADPKPPRLVVAAIQAIQQPVPHPDHVARCSLPVAVGQTLDVEQIAAWLLEHGFSPGEVVELPGEFSLRGGILDVYPADATEPLRLEFFGDDLESIRPFDPATQRSLGRLERCTLTALPPFNPNQADAYTHLAAYLPGDAWIALVEPADLQLRAAHYLTHVDNPRGLFSPEGALSPLLKHPSITLSALASVSQEQTCQLRVESVERFSGELARVREELDAIAADERVLIACHNHAEAERLAEVLAETTVCRSGRLTLAVGQVRAGFRLVDAAIAVVPDSELLLRIESRPTTTRRRYESRAIESFLDLNEGDLVVHVSHGIARYRGLQLADLGPDHSEEQLVLEFAEGVRLFVPIAKINLVQKYVGGGRSAPSLSKLGSTVWDKRKARVAEAVVDVAAELLEIQAQRASQPGFAFPAEDSHWVREFENAFPFQETPDQLAAIAAIKSDMASTRPMDRLLCGDVGFGKTEVAMRAAFRAVDAGKQVAVLVPTTVLAEQHYRTFSARMAEFPFQIAVVNRFHPQAQIRQILRATAAGQVDILIGTHRILQRDVRFKDLALVIIDEEQRFGVEDKEWLKSLRATVDVLTLTATPIPRTLHMALLGIRDISNLETPPLDRKAIETRIARWDDDLIRRAILRELNRDGQVYFVHNRVYDIDQLAQRLQTLVPDARIAVAHGQMPGDQLDRAMLAFVQRRADILVATTIIESGLDIPNANTIFIHQPERYGLADLHQLRGRVGRYKHRAYAYLLIDRDQPITPEAAKRLKAIEELTELGAGFKIALRDLEIRGAGSILGSEQSGHIEAVGYELYCSLLESAVRALTNRPDREPPECAVQLRWRAYLPRDYVPAPKLKVELYRRLSRLRSLDELSDFETELVDRFGPLPAPARNLLVETEIRLLATPWQIQRIHVEGDFLVLSYRSARQIEQLARRCRPGLIRIVDTRTAYIPTPESATTTDRVALLREILR
ncbi:MAG: transcription-repair-coupling factor [Isosphaeraceae bacterium]|nr:MAG: transcription-repair-coupling factor [Isosphaeraceae bacterium]